MNCLCKALFATQDCILYLLRFNAYYLSSMEQKKSSDLMFLEIDVRADSSVCLPHKFSSWTHSLLEVTFLCNVLDGDLMAALPPILVYYLVESNPDNGSRQWRACTTSRVRLHAFHGVPKHPSHWDTKSAQELEVLLRTQRERLRFCCGIQCQTAYIPMDLVSKLFSTQTAEKLRLFVVRMRHKGHYMQPSCHFSGLKTGKRQVD